VSAVAFTRWEVFFALVALGFGVALLVVLWRLDNVRAELDLWRTRARLAEGAFTGAWQGREEFPR
jgi:hypothetical protein